MIIFDKKRNIFAILKKKVIPWRGEHVFKTVITPRVYETDGIGHINNTIVPAWFEAGREGVFRIFNPDLTFSDWRMIIVNTNVDYTHQIYYGTDVEVYTWVEKVGNKSLVLYQEIYQNNKLCAKGTATYVNFNQETQKSEFIPPTIRIQLEEHLYAYDPRP